MSRPPYKHARGANLLLWLAGPPRRDRSALIGALSNLGIQYNFAAVTVALALMQPPSLPAGSPEAAYPRSLSQESLLKSLVFAGATLGQLVMGYAGDAWGRRKAMIFTNFLTVCGALGSALFTWGDAESVYSILMACRFVLGVGVGGKYPLAATIRSEAHAAPAHARLAAATSLHGLPPRSSATRVSLFRPRTAQAAAEAEAAAHSATHSATEGAKSFFWQTPGAILPYLVGLAVLAASGPTACRGVDGGEGRRAWWFPGMLV